MMLGLIAVFAAIVYKLGQDGAGTRRPPRRAVAGRSADRMCPPAIASSATALDGERALLTLAAPDGSTSLLLVDLASGAVLGRYAIEPE